LFGPLEKCRACGGTGQAIRGEKANSVIVDEIASPLCGIVNNRVERYVWLAQRWDAQKHNLTAGRWYLHEPGRQPDAVDDTKSPHSNKLTFSLDIDDRALNTYREEFPSRGFKIHTEVRDIEYQRVLGEYGSNPCVERGVLFSGFNANCGAARVEFFASEDSMGIAFVNEMSSYRVVTLASEFNNGAQIYLPRIAHGRP